MSLVQHWKLDDNAASTTVVATVGTNGTLEGGDNTSAKTVAGPGGSITAGLDLNGTDDAITVAASSISFASGSACSFSIWVEFDLANNQPFWGRSGANTHSIRKGTDTTIIIQASNPLTFTVASLGTTNWHHVLACKDTSANWRVFVDGVESSSGAQALSETFGPTYIGRRNTVFFDGKVAQAKVFDSDESANVAALYAEGVSGGNPGARVIGEGCGSRVISG